MNTVPRSRFQIIAVAALATAIFVGFTKTYYLKFLFDTPPLTRAAHLHGIIATLWVVLHYTQARLIAARRVDVHKIVGIVAAGLATVLVAQAISLGIANASAGHAPPGRNPLQFLSVSLGTSVTFALFVASALALRRKPDWHKRLMLLGTMTLLTPALGRLDTQIMQPLGLPRAVLGFTVTLGFIICACVHDGRHIGRIHPAYLIGGTLLLISMRGRSWLGTTEAWMPIAHWIVSN